MPYLILHTPPSFKYKGLTIIMSNPSRFDHKELISANTGDWFSNVCLRPEMNKFQCDIRDLNSVNDPLLPDTKAILILGEVASRELLRVNTSIHKLRGYPYTWNNLPAICSYLPQDAMDPIDHESRHNPLCREHLIEEKGEEDESDEKEHGFTKRSNWKFWLEKDTKRVLQLIQFGSIPVEPKPQYKIFAQAETIITELLAHQNEYFYLDLETDFDRNITCFGFNFSSSDIVFVVPVRDLVFGLYYGINTYRIFAALARAIKCNTTIAHNGHAFDFLVLAQNYRIPIGKVYDTLLAEHRIYTEAEKSLGHCMSLWTWMPYHKDEGIFFPHNRAEENKLWLYNAKDVWSMRLIQERQVAYARGVCGLTESIEQVNSAIKPYIINTLMGVRYDNDKVESVIRYNDRMMNQYLRCLRILCGHELNPRSSKQCINYFHNELGYKVVNRSEKTKEPKLGAEEMLKLKLEHPDNPVIDLCLAYRRVGKETSSLGFTPWQLISQS